MCGPKAKKHKRRTSRKKEKYYTIEQLKKKCADNETNWRKGNSSRSSRKAGKHITKIMQSQKIMFMVILNNK